MDLTELLKFVTKKEASDLHLKPGRPPLLRVNGRLVPLNYQLKNGEVIEVLRSKSSKGPSRDWMNANLGFIRTTHAREKIRQWFKRQERAENIARGKEMVEKELHRLGANRVVWKQRF
jgi:GTP pyrophosphokinase